MLDAVEPLQDAATRQAIAQLVRLTAIAMEIAEQLSAEIRRPEADAAKIGNVFTRLAKSVRMTIMLRARLACEGLAGAAAADAARRSARAERDAKASRAESTALGHEEGAEALGGGERFERAESAERGERPERFDELTVDEALAAIAEGLGLDAPIDLSADPATAPMPQLAAIFAAAGSGRRRRSPDAPAKAAGTKIPALPP